MKYLSILFLSMLAPLVSAAQTVQVSGKVLDGADYEIFLLARNGTSISANISASGSFKLRARRSTLRGASLHLTKGGQYWGPLTLAQKFSTQRAAQTLSGKTLPGKSSISLGRIALQEDSRFARPNRSVAARLRQSLSTQTDSTGRPIGAGELGLVSSGSVSQVGIRADNGQGGADPDQDGIPSILDADDDGDLILDSTDVDSAGADVPYTSLFLDFRRTLNAHVRSGLTDEAIDAIVSGENAFNFALFMSQPPNSQVTGGYVQCDDALTYCRRNTPLGFFGGVSESSDEFKNKPWSELLTSAGFPRLENLSLNGGGRAIVAAIQPRVPRSVFRAGDVIRAVLTNDAGREIGSRTFTVAPYFVSVPALFSYNAGAGLVTVDYSAVGPDSGSIPGTSPGDPIVLSSEGLLTVTFWRPQRQALRSDETGYLDIGGLNYGAIVDSLQATCAGLYTNVSSDLVADESPLGEGDSPLANTGANLRPYRDQQLDRAAAIENTLTYTVDLKTCLSRAGGSPGTYSVSISAAGQDVTGGTPAATQSIYVSIP